VAERLPWTRRRLRVNRSASMHGRVYNISLRKVAWSGSIYKICYGYKLVYKDNNNSIYYCDRARYPSVCYNLITTEYF
jgi:hypothetical protein